jgi:hypothetical protein
MEPFHQLETLLQVGQAECLREGMQVLAVGLLPRRHRPFDSTRVKASPEFLEELADRFAAEQRVAAARGARPADAPVEGLRTE